MWYISHVTCFFKVALLRPWFSCFQHSTQLHVCLTNSLSYIRLKHTFALLRLRIPCLSSVCYINLNIEKSQRCAIVYTFVLSFTYYYLTVCLMKIFISLKTKCMLKRVCKITQHFTNSTNIMNTELISNWCMLIHFKIWLRSIFYLHCNLY